MLDDFGNVAYFCRHDGSAAGEGFAQDNGRGLDVQRRDHNHVAGGKNIRRVPAISDGEHVIGQLCAVDCQLHFCTELEPARALTDDNKACVGAFLQNESRRLDKKRLAFIRPDHTDVTDERRFRI